MQFLNVTIISRTDSEAPAREKITIRYSCCCGRPAAIARRRHVLLLLRLRCRRGPMRSVAACAVLVAIGSAVALDNGLGVTPALGWSSWCVRSTRSRWHRRC